MLVQLNKCVVPICNGGSVDECLSLSILFKYESSRGHLFVRLLRYVLTMVV